MAPLPDALYSASQVREMDRIAIEEYAMPGLMLMKRAGRATLRALLERWPDPDCITVYCGAGNNGGDGYIVAALARQQGIAAQIVQVVSGDRLGGDARRALDYAVAERVPMTPWGEAAPPRQGVVVDALLGTGINGAVRAAVAAAIDVINGAGLPVVAVDTPSGLCSDRGVALGSCVRADLTVTFIGVKQGLRTGQGPAVTGELVFDDLGVPDALYQRLAPSVAVLDWRKLQSRLVSRAADAHKGLYGHVMVIGGDSGYGGAAIMAAEAALCGGAGLVSVATRPEHVAPLLARCPEVMAVGVTSGQAIEPWLSRPTVLVIGPGLGRSPWSEQMLQKAVATGLPMVVDADALNILAEGRVAVAGDSENWLLTPHPGEAGRLLGTGSAEVQEDRFAAVAALCGKFAGGVVLKGAGTLVAAPGAPLSLCPYGNPGMATGGMGDVLSGVLGALLAQGYGMAEAAHLGVCAHSLAADLAEQARGQRGLRATDLFSPLRALFNGAALREAAQS
jgi:NAD(P)H-hydrate epimerase